MTTLNNDRHGEPLAKRLVDAEILAWLDTHLGLLLAQTTEGSDAWKAVRQARYLNLSEFGTQLTPRILDVLTRAGLLEGRDGTEKVA